jgi:uncharacterized repeat protein (TIGR01451 family)
MKKIFLSFFLLFSCSSLFSQVNLQWYLNNSGSSNGFLNQMLKFPNGDLLVNGYNSGGDLDPGPGVTIINSNCFFARYTSTGVLVFARPLSYNATAANTTSRLEMDSDGNFYLSFKGGGVFDLDPGPGGLMTVSSPGQAFAKFNEMGVFQWGFFYNSSLMMYKFGVLNDKSVIVAGSCDTGNHDLNPGTGTFNVTATAAEEGFISKFDSSGNFITARKFDKSGAGYAFLQLYRMDIDQNDNLYFGGPFEGTFDMDPGPAQFLMSGTSQSPDPVDWLFVKLDNNLNFVYAHKFVGQINYDIIVDKFNDVYLFGDYANTIDMDLSSGVTNITSPVNHTCDFLAKYDSNATLKWVKTVVTTYSGSGFGQSFAYFDEQYLLNFDFSLYGSVTTNSFGFPQLPSNGFTTPGSYMVQLDTSGTCIFLQRVADNTSPKTLSAGLNNFYFSGRVYDALDIQIGPGVTINTPIGANEFFISYYSRDLLLNRIDGSAFLDLNNNGVKDGGENGLQNLIVHISPGGYFISTDNLGKFSAYIPTGSYTISIPSAPWYLSGPAVVQHTATFTSSNQIDTANNFAYTLNPGEMDMSIYLTPQGIARPGMNYNYNLIYSNLGNNIQSGTVEMIIDTAISVVSISPLPTMVNGNQIQWNYSNLNPQQSGNISLTVMVNSTGILGDSIIATANVSSLSGDSNPANNADTSLMVVLTSFDPNSKEVDPPGALTESMVANGMELTYTIRFQNVGNDTAFFVQVLDTLSTLLDVASLRIVGSSHPYIFNLHQGNLMEFRFNNILLPDSNVNELGSHGFIKYTIHPLTNLTMGDLIENEAYIYFDFNPAVQTNTTLTPIVDFIGLPEADQENFATAFPNPFTNQLTLVIKNKNISTTQILLRDIAGRLINTIESAENEVPIDTQNLSRGIYLLEIRESERRMFLRVCKL